MNLTDAELDSLLLALSSEGFSLPFAARSEDYLSPASIGEEHRAQIAALRAADDEAWDRNRVALRTALEAMQS